MKPIAVIILNWNGDRLLRRFLPSVIDNTPSDIADIIVADNGSSDNSTKLIRESFPNVKLLEFDKNYGFADGYNRAIATTGYEYTVLLNSDVAVKDDWLTPLYSAMESDHRLGAVQPIIRSVTEPEKFEYAGAAGGFLDRNGYPYCRGRIFDSIETDNGQYDDGITDCDWASGAALMVRTEIYLRAGGLDPRFFAHMEEIDLCWRIRRLGFRVAAITSGKVYHLGGGSLPASNPDKTYLNFRNNLLMLYKNLPESQRDHILIRRRLLDTLAWGKFIATLKFKNAAAIIRAHRDYARMKNAYTEAASGDNLLDDTTDIVKEYFIKGKHKYNEIHPETK